MISVATITREQYLQHRKGAARVSSRRLMPSVILFFVPIVILITVFGKKNPPVTKPEQLMFWSMTFIGLVGLVWGYVRMFLDRNLNAIYCPSCGKNNGGYKASRWLIASGKCIKCGEKMFPSSPDRLKSETESLALCADYKKRLKQAESAMVRPLLFVSIPLLMALIWLGRQYTSPTGPEPYHGGILIGILGVWAVALLVLIERVLNRSWIKCANCGSSPLRDGSNKIVLSTGCCVNCGNPMFASSPSKGGLAK
jgi:hypothetical protein